MSSHSFHMFRQQIWVSPNACCCGVNSVAASYKVALHVKISSGVNCHISAIFNWATKKPVLKIRLPISRLLDNNILSRRYKREPEKLIKMLSDMAADLSEKKDVIIKKKEKKKKRGKVKFISKKGRPKEGTGNANITDLPALWSFVVKREGGFLKAVH